MRYSYSATIGCNARPGVIVTLQGDSFGFSAGRWDTVDLRLSAPVRGEIDVLPIRCPDGFGIDGPMLCELREATGSCFPDKDLSITCARQCHGHLAAVW